MKTIRRWVKLVHLKAGKDSVLILFLFSFSLFVGYIMIEILISRWLYVSNIMPSPTVLVLPPFSLQKEQQITRIHQSCAGRLFNCDSGPLLPSSQREKDENNDFVPNDGWISSEVELSSLRVQVLNLYVFITKMDFVALISRICWICVLSNTLCGQPFVYFQGTQLSATRVPSHYFEKPLLWPPWLECQPRWLRLDLGIKTSLWIVLFFLAFFK